MEENKLFTLSIVAIAVALVGLGISLYLISGGSLGKLTGFASSGGNITISVGSTTSINFTAAVIDWGTGSVNTDGGNTAAYLSTTNGSIKGGSNWNTVSSGLVLENLGNVNVSLDLAFGKNATEFLEGTDPEYRYNVTDNKTSSCTPGGGVALGTWYDVNKTGAGTRVCSKLRFENTNDQIRVDIWLRVPSDSKTNQLNDTITATAAAV